MKYFIVAILAVLLTLIVCYLFQRNNDSEIKGSDVDPVVNIRYMEIREKDAPVIRMEMSYIGTVLSTANISFLEKNKNKVYMLMGAMPFNDKSWTAFLYNSKLGVEETGSLQVLNIDKISSDRASWLYFSGQPGTVTYFFIDSIGPTAYIYDYAKESPHSNTRSAAPYYPAG